MFHPYVNLDSGKMAVDIATKHANLWLQEGMHLLIQSIWNLFHDVTIANPSSGLSLPNEEAVVVKKKNLSEFLHRVKLHALRK